MRTTPSRSLALAATLSIILMLSVAYYWPIQEPYHPLNTDWNGCSKIADASANRTLLFSYDKPLPNGSLLAIIAPTTDFSKFESTKILNFLRDGGIVFLADDFGSGNSLLAGLYVSARFSGKPLGDLYYYSKQHSFPLVSNFSPDAVTANVTRIMLDYPTYIEIGNSSEVKELASSSPFSFIDLNGNGEPSVNETLDSYPVMVKAKIGRGSLIAISDSSMFMNEIVDLYGNMRLFQNLLDLGGGSLLFDTAHLSKAPLTDWRVQLKNGIDLVRAYVFLSTNGIYIQALIIASVLVLSISLALLRAAKGRRPAK